MSFETDSEKDLSAAFYRASTFIVSINRGAALAAVRFTQEPNRRSRVAVLGDGIPGYSFPKEASRLVRNAGLHLFSAGLRRRAEGN